MDRIDTSSFVPHLKKVTAPFEFTLEDIQVVESIPQWCADNGVEEDKPLRTAKVVRNRDSGRYLILLSAQVTPEMVESVKSRMRAEGLGSAADELSADQDFLIHRVLHELYHAVHDMLGKPLSATECDRWAFQQMGILSSD